LVLLGEWEPAVRTRLLATIAEMVTAQGLGMDDDVVVRDATHVGERDPKAASVLAYFAGGANPDAGIAADLLRRGVPTVPVVSAGGSFDRDLPDALKAPNGLRLRRSDPGMVELATALLECLGLLREQRRVFISYRRTESRNAAVQLHDLLNERGFDVFLDTHDIRPGEPFQEVLWHRLTDCDVVVMLDTPTYFERKWTREEFGRALAKKIHILRLVWPEHAPTRHLDAGEMVRLSRRDMQDDETLIDAVANDIVLKVETLRSLSIAARHASLADKLRVEVEGIGGTVDGIGAHRAIAVTLPGGRRVWAYPVVGVPTASLLNDIADRAERADHGEMPFLVYDHVGISKPWMDHLGWLDSNISAVRSLQVFEAGWRLVEWGS
jgi:hypothetical protein